SQAVQQIEVVHDAEEGLVGDDLAAEGDDERLAAQRVNVRRGGADPWHEQFRVESHRSVRCVALRRCRITPNGEMPTIFIAPAIREESIEFPGDTQCGVESPI